MERIQRSAVSVFSLVFALLFFLISWLGTTEPYFEGILPAQVAVIAVSASVLVFVLSYLGTNAKRSVRRKAETLFLIFFFCIYLGIQIYIASEMYSRPGAAWDFNVVAGHAAAYGNYTGSDAKFVAKVLGKDGQWYYSSWPNNAPLYVMLAYFFRLLGPLGLDLNFAGIGLNIFCIDLALLLLYLSVRKATGSVASARTALLLACLHGALLFYVPIYYTDTLTLPCVAGGLFLWLCAAPASSGSARRETALLAGSAAVLAVGSVLKFSVVILFIGEILTETVTQPVKKAIRRILVLLAVFLLIYAALQYACLNAPIVVVDKQISYIPKLHWVMMGLSGNGDYNDADYQLTISVPPEERDAFVRSMIVQRVKDLGFSGMIRHLHEKIAFVWGEGTYFSSVKIDRCRAKASWLDRYVNYLGKEFLPYATYSEGLMVFTEVMMALSGVFLAFRKEKDPCLVLAEISVFGLFLFECLWEARSRYLFNFLPVFLFLIDVSVNRFFAGAERKQRE